MSLLEILELVAIAVAALTLIGISGIRQELNIAKKKRKRRRGYP